MRVGNVVEKGRIILRIATMKPESLIRISKV